LEIQADEQSNLSDCISTHSFLKSINGSDLGPSAKATVTQSGVNSGNTLSLEMISERHRCCREKSAD
jgi:hypothetical protein